MAEVLDNQSPMFVRLDGTKALVRTLEGTERVVETRMDFPSHHMALSPDGATLAIVGMPRKRTLFGWKPGRNEERQLWLADIDSGEMRHLDGPLIFDVRWFPDGRRLVYQDHIRQFVSAADGTNGKMICSVPSTTGFEALTVSPQGTYTAAQRAKSGSKHLVLHDVSADKTTATKFQSWNYGWVDEETIVFNKTTSRGDEIRLYEIPSGNDVLVCKSLADCAVAADTPAGDPIFALLRADATWERKQYSRVCTSGSRIFFIAHAYFEEAHYFGVVSMTRDGTDLRCHCLETSQSRPEAEERVVHDLVAFNAGRSVCVCVEFIVHGIRIRSEWRYYGDQAAEMPTGYVPLVDHSTRAPSGIMPWTVLPKLRAHPIRPS